MGKDKKPTNKINPYWVYGIVITIFIAIQIFSGSISDQSSNATTPAKFIEYLEKGDVSKIEIINKREAKVYLTKEASNKEVHKKSKPNSLIPGVGLSPNYVFEFGDLQNFEKAINQAIADNNLNTELKYRTEENVWGNLLFSILPIVIIIAVWIFIMRRMSGGGSGGAGGQLFNIGKSKARLFDEKTDTKTTFKDVDCIKIPWVIMSCNNISKSPSSILNSLVHRWNHNKKHPYPKKKFACRYDKILQTIFIFFFIPFEG